MKKIFCAIIIACFHYSSFGGILEEYVPENLDVFDSDTIKYLANAEGYIDAKSIPLPDCEAFNKIATYHGFTDTYGVGLDVILTDFYSWIDSK